MANLTEVYSKSALPQSNLPNFTGGVPSKFESLGQAPVATVAPLMNGGKKNKSKKGGRHSRKSKHNKSKKGGKHKKNKQKK